MEERNFSEREAAQTATEELTRTHATELVQHEATTRALETSVENYQTELAQSNGALAQERQATRFRSGLLHLMPQETQLMVTQI